MNNKNSDRINDFYRVMIHEVKYPNVGDFDCIERQIEADEEVEAFDLKEILLSKVATARSCMLDRLDHDMENY